MACMCMPFKKDTGRDRPQVLNDAQNLLIVLLQNCQMKRVGVVLLDKHS